MARSSVASGDLGPMSEYDRPHHGLLPGLAIGALTSNSAIASRTEKPGLRWAIIASLPTTAPRASISALSTSKARPPSLIGSPSASSSRRAPTDQRSPPKYLAILDPGAKPDNMIVGRESRCSAKLVITRPARPPALWPPPKGDAKNGNGPSGISSDHRHGAPERPLLFGGTDLLSRGRAGPNARTGVSKNEMSPTGDRWFESISLQQGDAMGRATRTWQLRRCM
jgi:hypothetical protein